MAPHSYPLPLLVASLIVQFACFGHSLVAYASSRIWWNGKRFAPKWRHKLFQATHVCRVLLCFVSIVLHSVSIVPHLAESGVLPALALNLLWMTVIVYEWGFIEWLRLVYVSEEQFTSLVFFTLIKRSVRIIRTLLSAQFVFVWALVLVLVLVDIALPHYVLQHIIAALCLLHSITSFFLLYMLLYTHNKFSTFSTFPTWQIVLSALKQLLIGIVLITSSAHHWAEGLNYIPIVIVAALNPAIHLIAWLWKLARPRTIPPSKPLPPPSMQELSGDKHISCVGGNPSVANLSVDNGGNGDNGGKNPPNGQAQMHYRRADGTRQSVSSFC